MVERQPKRISGTLARLPRAALLAAGLTVSPGAWAQDGSALFRTSCAACHTIGGGRLVGPDLAGVTARRTEAWLIPFIQGSQAVIASGDSIAVALSREYVGLVMPDWPLSDDEVRAILGHLAAASDGGPLPAAAPAATPSNATPEQVRLGRALFQGRVRLANGGPTCNSCHHVTHDAVIGGGVLARELTTVFTRLGGPGVRAVIGSPPFPVMQRAYQGRPLTELEVAALVAFLEDADAHHALQHPRDYGLRLFWAGLVGAAALLGFYTLAWRGRRTGSVYRAIFARQVKTV